VALLRDDADPAVVLAREARRDRQGDPGALGLFRREEGLEDVAEIAATDPGAGVVDVDAGRASLVVVAQAVVRRVVAEAGSPTSDQPARRERTLGDQRFDRVLLAADRRENQPCNQSI
jgi:hypothetical protein